MRDFRDGTGRRWEVTVGRESWGTLVLVFAPEAGTGVRRSVLRSETQVAAEQELAELSEEELRARLAESEPWG